MSQRVLLLIADSRARPLPQRAASRRFWPGGGATAIMARAAIDILVAARRQVYRLPPRPPLPPYLLLDGEADVVVAAGDGLVDPRGAG